MTLTLKQLRYFMAAAETGQVSLAAMEMNVSQSAVTAAIQALEAQLGVRLFDRSVAGVSLTPEGARFINHARAVSTAVEDAVRAPLGQDSELTGAVTVGMTYTVAGYFMARHYIRFRRSYPGIRLSLIELPRRAIEEGLGAGEIDIAVMLVSNITRGGPLQHEALFRSRRRLWLPGDHGLLAAEKLSLADIAQEPYIMLTVDEAGQTAVRYWHNAGFQPNVVFATSSVEAVRSMVAAGVGVTILSDMVYRPWSLEGQRIELRTLTEAIPSMDVGLAWSDARDLSAAAQVFRAFMSVALGGGNS